MNKKYIIQWKSKVNGRVGKGTKLFDYDEALDLADELNLQDPGIEHEIMEDPNNRGNMPQEQGAEDQSNKFSKESPSESAPVLSFQE